jgi:prevent-host-death family protein
MCYMKRPPPAVVGVRELRQNLSVYLRRVQRGETLTVTERRRTVAVLAPAARGEDAVERLIAEGRAVPSRRPVTRLPKALRLRSSPSLRETLDEQSRDTI